MRLEAPRLGDVLSDTEVKIQLFPLTSSTRDHVTHYYVAVVPANLRVASNDVRLDEVKRLQQRTVWLRLVWFGLVYNLLSDRRVCSLQLEPCSSDSSGSPLTFIIIIWTFITSVISCGHWCVTALLACMSMGRGREFVVQLAQPMPNDDSRRGWIAARFDGQIPPEMIVGNGRTIGDYVNRPLMYRRAYKIFVRAFTADNVSSVSLL